MCLQGGDPTLEKNTLSRVPSGCPQSLTHSSVGLLEVTVSRVCGAGSQVCDIESQVCYSGSQVCDTGVVDHRCVVLGHMCVTLGHRYVMQVCWVTGV